MKLCPARNSRGTSGILLIECLVYMTLWVAIAGLAFAAFYRTLDNARALDRNASQIARSLHAGEIWRADIRSASGRISTEGWSNTIARALHIPTKTNEVTYFYDGFNIFRRAATNAPWSQILGGVLESDMIEDAAPSVKSWRWELEFRSGHQGALSRPRFTFQAVPMAR